MPEMMAASSGYAVGDWIKDFTLKTADGKATSLADHIGVHVVLAFLPHDAGGEAAASALRDLYAEFASLGTPVLGICPGESTGEDTLDGPAEVLPFPLLFDPDGAIAREYGASGLRGVLLDPALRVARIYEPSDAASLARQMLDGVRAIVDREPPRNVIQQAPVLIISNVLSSDFCRELIQVWESEGNIDSGFMVDKDGKTVPVLDYNHKIRRDHFLPPRSARYARVREIFGRRVMPEIGKVFNFPATRMEEIKIACYDASTGGYFRPHRDNTTGGTAHRRFAMSLLLNDEYEGGYLRFPEYGPHLYRPETGGAVVFSCSLLHEATDVTAGRRFVLLTFFYGESDARAREQYNRRVGGAYRA